MQANSLSETAARPNPTSGNQPFYWEKHGQGKPVILIHGLAASLRGWDYLIPELVAAGYAAYAIDLPGHGRSHQPQQPAEYHIEAIYAQMVNWIETLALQAPAVLVTHSLGGYLGLLYALRQPEQVECLVLTNPFFTPEQLIPPVRYFMHRPRLPIRMWAAAPTWLVEIGVQLVEGYWRKLPEQMQQQIASDFQRTSPKILHIPSPVQDLTPRLAGIQQPACVIWSRRDRTLRPRFYPRLVEQLPHSQQHVFPKCGHVLHLTNPQVYNQVVLDFLGTHPKKPA
ncbi:MAG: alpha/beta hydrolase [Anaerolineales bacterium]|nr:alpha/beta hydrolase [Anaerolineales bacterium]